MNVMDSSRIDDKVAFRFGANWRRFLKRINAQRIEGAVAALQKMLAVESLAGRRFVDAGSGAGLSSLAARRLGASSIVSFDYDPESVACTREVRRVYAEDDPRWVIAQGSVLDRAYIDSLGQFDVVYSWGVLHHTGNMWAALENVMRLVAKDGSILIALYNDQGWISRYWLVIKQVYVRHPFMRWPLLLLHAPYLFLLRGVVRFVTRRGRLERGMSLWYDMRDWVGGYPFEVATPARVADFMQQRGYQLTAQKTCGSRHGCNEFVFSKNVMSNECLEAPVSVR